MSSIERIGPASEGGGSVPLGALEQLCVLAHGTRADIPWLAQLILTSEDGSGGGERTSHRLIAVATVHLESLWRIARAEGLLDAPADTAATTDEAFADDPRSHITQFVYDPRVVDFCLNRLRATVRQLACPITVSSLVIHPQPFCPENGLQTPTFRLLRGLIRKTFVSRKSPAGQPLTPREQPKPDTPASLMSISNPLLRGGS
jgi:hypothetical protein